MNHSKCDVCFLAAEGAGLGWAGLNTGLRARWDGVHIVMSISMWIMTVGAASIERRLHLVASTLHGNLGLHLSTGRRLGIRAILGLGLKHLIYYTIAWEDGESAHAAGSLGYDFSGCSRCGKLPAITKVASCPCNPRQL